jgi:hypothetical protein
MALHVEDSPLGTSSGSSTKSFGAGHSDADSCSVMKVFLHRLSLFRIHLLPEPGASISRRRFYSIVDVLEADLLLVFFWQQ